MSLKPIISILIILICSPELRAEKNDHSAASPPKSDLIREFIQYQYLVIGGGLKEGSFYRAKTRIFEEGRTLMIERKEGGLSETVELIKVDAPEQLTTWVAHFVTLKVNITYVARVYHDNYAILVGEGQRIDQDGKELHVGETAFPDTYESTEEEVDTDEPATTPALESKNGGKSEPALKRIKSRDKT